MLLRAIPQPTAVTGLIIEQESSFAVSEPFLHLCSASSDLLEMLIQHKSCYSRRMTYIVYTHTYIRTHAPAVRSLHFCIKQQWMCLRCHAMNKSVRIKQRCRVSMQEDGYIQVSMSVSISCTLHSSTTIEVLAVALAVVVSVAVKTHWFELFSWWFFMSS